MRFTFVLALFTAALASAAPVFRRDIDGAKAAFDTIQSSANYPALVSNSNTFFANLNGVASTEDINRAVDQVNDQIAANNKDKVPVGQTAAWVSSVLNHFVAGQ
ncbi:hypothetical protein COEREDRAFT_82487 [Coemansia reversa NRRL 1564]|uniref:Uncharacterized protein n=1 Tax=Coemansia reversa (strain ATCC 12441 / NRRL 1564) TaxID=763665 RepID=A0A2G5B6U7_COERN|nr:hypothetical protein COEREDRAFT_82487 [Coemansia reversa NRRL 1564]|eukprot:PIA14729.1 hypothetical protein COEREDRAFT_82487 [Coemansia reversa NRRL 1564]